MTRNTISKAKFKLQSSELYFGMPRQIEIQKFYEQKVANRWLKSKLPSIVFTTQTMNKKYRKLFLNKINEILSQNMVSKGKILSLGVGTSVLEKELKDKGWNIFGIDIANQFASNANKMGIQSVLGDAEKTPFRGNFDALICNETIGHLNLEKTTKEMGRLLNKGSPLILSTYSASETGAEDNYTLFSKSEIESALKKYFDIVEFKELNKMYWFIAKKK